MNAQNGARPDPCAHAVEWDPQGSAVLAERHAMAAALHEDAAQQWANQSRLNSRGGVIEARVSLAIAILSILITLIALAILA